MIPGDIRRLDISPIRAVKLQTNGSSWRVVMDIGGRLPLYQLLYSRRKVGAVAERRIMLEPTGQ